MLKEYWDLFREWVKNTLRSRIFWLGIVCTLFLAVLVVRLFQLQILDGAAYYDSYVSRTKKEITTTATRGTIYDRNGVVLAGNEAVYNLTVKDTSEYTKANGDFNEMLLRLIEIVKKYDGTIVTELPVMMMGSLLTVEKTVRSVSLFVTYMELPTLKKKVRKVRMSILMTQRL